MSFYSPLLGGCQVDMMPFVDINEKLLSRPLADCHTVLFYSTWGLMSHIHSQQMDRDAICLNASFIFLVKVCLMGPKQDILHVCTNICFSRRINLVQHCPARTLANKAATASLANVWGRGSCTDGSQAGRQTDIPVLLGEFTSLVFTDHSLVRQVTFVPTQNDVRIFTVCMDL